MQKTHEATLTAQPGWGPPGPAGNVDSIAGASDPDAPQPRAFIYREARRLGLTERESQELVAEVGLSVARLVANGQSPREGVVKLGMLLRLTRWKIVDYLRLKAKQGNGKDQEFSIAV